MPPETLHNSFDVAIIGAGPAGLAAACAAVDRGLTHVLLDRAGLAQSFVEYPHNLQFFSPPDEAVSVIETISARLSTQRARAKT